MSDNICRLAGLIGHPVEHSLSPVIHEAFAKATNINMKYLLFNVENGRLGDAVKGLDALSFVGANVTVPYKIDIMEHILRLDDAARTIGAVNTLVPTLEGIVGYNTDYSGFIRMLRTNNIDIEARNVIILGAGGVSNAVLHAVVTLKAKNILICNRTSNKASALAAKYNNSNIYVTSFDDDITEAMDKISGNSYQQWIAIQCTSVGMYPNVTDVVIDLDAFYRRVAYGVDVIYNPEKTRFMQRVEAFGGKICNGLDMLIYQAAEAYELWTGKHISEDIVSDVRRVITAGLSQ